uniref:Uncharacterized protein n=3 Tax=Enterobacteriaceae TaxID=543 RepID=A0A7D3TCY6_ECOLX|nr:hypothetical protein EBPLCOIM_00145 [Klebsiella pneumoniae subsp. pneumoniae]AUG89069.1 hypothetical protein ALNCGNHI_00060 [Klebsiella pneumoniae]QJR99268.1 hypothetical protein DELFAIOC_00102 [Escherichia coli]UII03471.1 hypothetical protein EMEBAPAD_00114 [Klebsiella quasipneumoniae subsp. similipneumoniae]QGF03414.1 hypothetical protein pVir-SCNJ1-169 [Klebsiella pneumoniae subsp. pneumoniae]
MDGSLILLNMVCCGQKETVIIRWPRVCNNSNGLAAILSVIL